MTCYAWGPKGHVLHTEGTWLHMGKGRLETTAQGTSVSGQRMRGREMPKNLQAMQCARKDWTGLGIRRALLAPEKDVGGPHPLWRQEMLGWLGGGGAMG